VKIDYCTLAPDRIKSYDLSGCCLLHDEGYAAKTAARAQVDQEFRE